MTFQFNKHRLQSNRGSSWGFGKAWADTAASFAHTADFIAKPGGFRACRGIR